MHGHPQVIEVLQPVAVLAQVLLAGDCQTAMDNGSVENYVAVISSKIVLRSVIRSFTDHCACLTCRAYALAYARIRYMRYMRGTWPVAQHDWWMVACLFA